MENRITVDVYVEKKLSEEIAELKVQLSKTEFQALVLKEENQQLKKTIEELETKTKECENEKNEEKVSQESTETN